MQGSSRSRRRGRWPGSRVGELPYRDAALVTVDRRGHVTPLPAPVRSYGPSRARLSRRPPPRGDDSDPDRVGLWLYDLGRGTLTPLVAGAERSLWPVWSPDGQRLVFRGSRTAGGRSRRSRRTARRRRKSRWRANSGPHRGTRWTAACSGHGRRRRRHPHRDAREWGCPRAAAVSDAPHENRPGVLAGRPLAGVRIERVGAFRGLRPAVPGSRASGTGVRRRRRESGVESQRQRSCSS